MATAKQLDDITECPICTEVYTDPRVLPCGHTYCLKCIEAWSKDKQAREELARSLCRKQFICLAKELAVCQTSLLLKLPTFLQMKASSRIKSKTSPCEACSGGEESESEVQNVASVYCIECQMKLCQNCERGHKVIKATRSHKLISIGEKVNVETLCRLKPASYCDQHQDKSIEFYCFDCKMALCMMCHIERHSRHRCSDVNKVHGNFCRQMARDTANVADGIENMTEMLESLDRKKNKFMRQVEKAGVEIIEKAEQLKRMIDDHKEKLMNELSSVKQKRMKEIESLREEIETLLMSMESYKKYVDEVRQKGTACDIARAASGLHDRADELLTFDVIERTLADLGHADVTFTSSNYVIDDVGKTLGHLHRGAAKTGKSN